MFTLLVPLLIAAISGLAYLAVKHPAVYEKLFGRVYFISGIVFGALLIWSGSISWAHTTLLQFIEPEKHASAKASIEAITIPVPWLLLAQFVVIGYLFFLSWLGHQIEQDKRTPDTDA